MDPIINTALLTPRNIFVIGMIAVLWHIALLPVFAAVGSRQDS